ncbi:MAG: VTC domain-containing protein, partial [Bacteroidales bacterium]
VRFRKYGTSELHFLEVKTKNARGFTIKNRVKTNGMGTSILTTEEEFLLTYTPYHASNMVPVLGNQFNRITLVRHDQSERITLDYGLRFMSPDSEELIDLPGVSIGEIKYKGLLAGSPFHNVLRRMHITPSRFSKYAIGAALLYPNLKQNRFKMKIRKLSQINELYLNNIKSDIHA